ncbi:MAG: bifunctional diaminohydroxyphosphoribosylaminopyrimidine deaminase/5-amino-6-(5-phosphoribosylamino)uracil reductase RibD [Ignavibacteriales bacterium]|nr:bifunctional diaminohydroxyphosphoribosylaminopyrimidine deaminase/5-amino-6-(5-phosphoribosylamino)uracil reductase RibD [Ignavibacteriales bacterium]
MNQNNDEKFLRRCFELARRGAGCVSPNPLVGSVIIKDGRIISEGLHEKFGEPHAEANAIKRTSENLEGAAIYCSLEPCSHTDKKTPPCVPLIIESGIKKVVVSNLDPNPKVAGRGIEQLRNAGVEAVVGICEEEGNELNRFYFKSVSKKLPYVTVKIAQTMDRKIAEAENRRTQITGSESAEFVHKQRSIYDAVLVGKRTVNTDNPQLNVRNVNGRNPVRIILDGSLNVNPSAVCLNDENRTNSWIFCSDKIDNGKVDALTNKGVKVFRIEVGSNGRIDLRLLLSKLNDLNIQSVFVEGGKEIFSQFISESLFDELIILQAPIILGKGVDAFDMDFRLQLKLFSAEKIGEDQKLVYRKIL